MTRNNNYSFKLSKRLSTVAEWVKKGNIVADVGTDHGYLPIYIVKENISEHVIAMDVRKGPLQKAKDNVKAFGVEEAIDLRLSDGLDMLQPMEAETITICGMGGRLMQNILSAGAHKTDCNTQLLLSPQSEFREFRNFLYNNGYKTVRETMLKEDKKFYLIMECKRTCTENECESFKSDEDNILQNEAFLRFGKLLLEQKNPVLKEYIEKELRKAHKVMAAIVAINTPDEAVGKRKKEVQLDIDCMEYALGRYL